MIALILILMGLCLLPRSVNIRETAPNYDIERLTDKLMMVETRLAEMSETIAKLETELHETTNSLDKETGAVTDQGHTVSEMQEKLEWQAKMLEAYRQLFIAIAKDHIKERGDVPRDTPVQ